MGKYRQKRKYGLMDVAKLAVDGYGLYKKFKRAYYDEPKKPGRTGGDSAITQYHEDKVLYRRRRANRRMRKRARRATRNFRKQIIQHSGAQRVVRTFDGTASAAEGFSSSFDCLIYTYYDGSGSTTNSDLADIDTVIIPAMGVLPPSTNSRLLYNSCFMDITIQNSGANALFLDCYYVKCRRSTAGSARNDFVAIDTTKWAGETAITHQTLGITPYDSNQFTAHWVITKHRRILLPAGQSTELTVMDRKNRYWDVHRETAADTGTVSNIGKAGWTQGILFQIEGAALSAANGVPDACSVKWFIAKVYSANICPSFTPTTTGLV